MKLRVRDMSYIKKGLNRPKKLSHGTVPLTKKSSENSAEARRDLGTHDLLKLLLPL
jgi:hypothetical protein